MEKALIYFTNIDPLTATPDDMDVYDQVKFVSEALLNLGYEPVSKPFKRELLKHEIKNINPAFIFNLVEDVEGSEEMAYLAPMAYESAGMKYTGCTMNAFKKSGNKIKAKKLMDDNGIKTPYYLTRCCISDKDLKNKRYIIKDASRHASRGLEPILYEDKETIKRILNDKWNFLAEEYIEGREFNISLIGPKSEGIVLPIAEMQFIDWQEGKLKIVDYEAKWNSESKEYNSTVRNFDFPLNDKVLIDSLEDICKKCWKLFDLRGYARIDFRVSLEGEPYVLEVNANPCISPDAGFIAAAERAGFSQECIIKKIIDYSLKEN